MRTLAILVVPCVLAVAGGCEPPLCGSDLEFNEATGLCDCRTGGTFGDDGYCRYADGAITLPDGAIPMADGGGEPDASAPDADPDACAITAFYRDADGDGHGISTDSVSACAAPGGYVVSDDDCNDACDACLPGGVETCTEPALDEDCDGSSNEPDVCSCTDGASISCGGTEVGECALGTQECVDGAYSKCEGATSAVPEVCNGLDDDCDGSIDEGVLTTFYRDSDDDTFGNLSVTMLACTAPAGYVTSSADCNDACATCRPGGTEICDGLDNNCAGGIDEAVQTTFHVDCDGDGYASSGAASLMACSAPARPLSCGPGPGMGWTSRASGNRDCLDTNEQVHPGQTAFFSAPIRGTGSYDYNCDGLQTRRITATSMTANDCTESATCDWGWTGSTVPNCGSAADVMTCFPIFGGSGCGGAVISPNQVQACR